METMLTIGEVAHRSGLAASAIRFYEREGLVRAERTPSGQRRFHRDVLRRIAFIRIAQRVGLSLNEIVAALAGLPADRAPNSQDWQRLTRGWRQRLDDRHRAAGGVAQWSDQLHRVRLPIATDLCAVEPGRRGVNARDRPAVSP